MAAGDLSLSILIGASLDSSFGGAIGAASNALQQLTSGNVLGAVGAAATAAGVALVAMGSNAVQAAGNFQQSMTQLVTGANESQSNLQMVSDGVLQISTQTGTASTDLASALYTIESGGAHGASGLQVLQTAAEGAKVGNADLTTTANALMSVLTDYHQPASQATGDMNALITAVADGRTHMQNMASAMGSVLPVASSLGISFPQVSGAIADMTNHGMTAQRASTNLANALRALAAPGTGAQKSLTSIGLSAQQLHDTLANQGLPAALQLIETHIGKTFPAGSEQAVAAYKSIMGGATGYNVALQLGGSNMAGYEANIKNITAAMNAGGNSVEGWAAIQADFNQRVDEAKSALQAFMIILGEKLLPLLSPIVAGFTNIISIITNFVSGITTAGSSGNVFSGVLQALGINTQTAQNIFNLLGITISYLSGIFQSVGSIVKDIFGAAFQMVSGIVVNFVNNDLAGLIATVNGVVFTVYEIVSAFADWLNQTNAVGIALSALGDVISGILDIALPVFEGLVTDALTFGQEFVQMFAQGISGVIDVVTQVVTAVAQEISDFLGFASPTKKGPGSKAHTWGPALVQTLASGMLTGAPMITDAVNKIASQLQVAVGPGGAFHTAMASFTNPMSGDKMKVSVQPMVDGLKNGAGQVQGATKTLSNQIGSVANTANKTSTNTAATMTTKIAAGMTSGVPQVQTAANAVGNALSTVCSTHAKSASTCASSHLTTGLASKLTSGASHVKSASNTVGSTHHVVATHAAKASTTAAHHVTTGLSSSLKSGASKVKTAAATVASGLDAIGAHAKTVADNVGQSFTNAFAPIQKAGSGVAGILKNISDAFSGVGKSATTVSGVFQSFIGWINNGSIASHLFVAALAGVAAGFLAWRIQIAAQAIPAILQFIATIPALLVQLVAWATTQWGVVVSTWALIGPYVLIGVAVAAVVFAIIEVIQHWGAITTWLKGVWQNFSTWFIGMLTSFSHVPAIAAMVSFFKVAWSEIVSDAKWAWDGVMAQLQPIIALLVKTWNDATKQIQDAFSGIGKAIAPALAQIQPALATLGKSFQLIFKDLETAWKQIQPVLAQVASIVGGALASAWKQLQPVLQQIWAIISPQLTTALTIFGGVLGGMVLLAIVSVIGALVGLIKGLATFAQGLATFITGVVQVFSGLVQIITGIVATIVDICSGHFEKLGTDLGVIWTGIKTMFSGIWNMIVGLFQMSVGAMISVVSGFITTIISFFTNLYNQLVGHSIIPDMIDGITSWFMKLPSFFTEVFQMIGTLFTSAWNQFETIVSAINTAIVTGIQTFWKSIQTIFANAWNTFLATPLGGLLISFGKWAATLQTNLGNWALSMMKWFGQQILNGVSFVTNAAGSVASEVKKILGIASPAQAGPLSTADQWMPNFMNMLALGITADIPKVMTPVNTLATTISQKFATIEADVSKAVALINKTIGLLGTNFTAVVSAFTTQLGNLSSAIKTAFTDIGSVPADTVNTFVNAIIASFADLYDQLVGSSIVPDIVTGIEDWFNQLPDFFTTISDTIIQNFLTVWNTIKTDVTTFLTTLKNLLTTTWTTIQTEAKNAWGKVRTEIQSVWGTIQTDVKNALKQVGSLFTNAYQTYFASSLNILLSSLKTWFATLATNFGTWGTNAISMFTKNLLAGIPQVTNTAIQIANVIKSYLGFSSPPSQGPLSTSATWMPNMMNMLASGIVTNIPKVLNPLNQLYNAITSKFNEMQNTVTNNVNNINRTIQTLGNQLTSVSTNIITALTLLAFRVNQEVVQINMTLQTLQKAIQQAGGNITGQITIVVKNVTGQMNTLGQSITVSVTVITKQFSQMPQSAQAATAAVSGFLIGLSTVVGGTAQTVASAMSDMSKSSQAAGQQVTQVNVKIGDSSQQCAQQVDQAHSTMRATFGKTSEATTQVVSVVDRNTQAIDQNLKQADDHMHDAIMDILKAINDQLLGDGLGAMQKFVDGVKQLGGAAVNVAQADAAAIANLLGHTKPKVGPLKDDDLWGKHMVENIVGGMQQAMPLLTGMTNQIASTMASVGLGPLASGSPTIRVATPANNQPMIINLNLDKKVLGKVVTNYQRKEIHAQGAVRNI